MSFSAKLGLRSEIDSPPARSRKSREQTLNLSARRRMAFAVVLIVGPALRPTHAADITNYLFAISSQHAEAVVIDGSSDKVVDRITLPNVPSDIAVLSHGRYLVVADKQAGQLRIIDVAAGRLERSVDVPLHPDILRTDRTGTILAALDHDSGRIALATADISEFRLVPNLTGATYMVFDVNGRVLAAHPAGVSIVNATGNRGGELAVERADGPVTDVATDPGGQFAFVEQPTSGVLSIFDLRHDTREAVLHLPAPLGRVVPSLNSQFVLVPIAGRSIASISTWTLQEKARIHLDIDADGVGLAFLQSIAVVTSRSDRTVLLYDLSRERRSGEIRLPSPPGSGIASNDGIKFHIALPATGQIASVNVITGQLDRLIDNVGVGVQTVLPAANEGGYCH